MSECESRVSITYDEQSEERGEERRDEWKVLVKYESGIMLLLSLRSSSTISP